MVAGPSIRGRDPNQRLLQRSLASVSTVSNSSWNVEAEVSPGRWSLMDGEKIKLPTIPYHASLAENSRICCSHFKYGFSACSQ